jgi:hypothetical protein
MQLILKRQSYTLSSSLENLRTRNERTFACDMLICNLRLFSSGTDREAPSFVYKHKELFVWFIQWQVTICNVGKYVAETLIILSVNAESSCMNTEKGTQSIETLQFSSGFAVWPWSPLWLLVKILDTQLFQCNIQFYILHHLLLLHEPQNWKCPFIWHDSLVGSMFAYDVIDPVSILT